LYLESSGGNGRYACYRRMDLESIFKAGKKLEIRRNGRPVIATTVCALLSATCSF